jgi:major type 1 subunit fimbrin (pilin)
MPIIFNAHASSCQPGIFQQPGNRLVWLAKVLLLLLLLTGVESVFAYSFTCASNTTLSSPFAFRVISSAAQDDKVIASGSLFALLSRCKNNSAPGTTSFNVAIPTDNSGTPLLGASGVTVASSALPSVTITTVSGGSCSLVSTSYSGGSTYITLNHPVGATCSYQVSFPLTLTMHTTNGPIAGAVGNDLTSRSPLNGGSGWLLYSGPNNSFVGLGSTLTLIATTCTLSTKNVTVTLPKIATSALGGPGATAGRTPFVLALAGCSNVGSAYSVTANWSFVEGAAGTNTIANSAAGPASNVYVQLLDRNLATIDNGGTSNLATVSSAGSYQTQHYAQYYAGGPVGAGLVKGVATLTLSYE